MTDLLIQSSRDGRIRSYVRRMPQAPSIIESEPVSPFDARAAVLRCFYHTSPVAVEVTDIFAMILVPRAQICQALQELVASQELEEVPGGDADFRIPAYRRLNAWGDA